MLRTALLLACSCVASAASAQDADDDAPDETEARALFAAGSSAFEAGRYEDALRDFARAYELSERPAFLYNVALAYEKLGLLRSAVTHFRRYRAAVPDAENGASVDRRIERLLPLAEAEAEEAERREHEDVSDPGPWPWVVVGSGGGLFIIGLVLHVAGQVDASAVESPSDPMPRWEDVMDAAGRAPALMNAGIVLGSIGLAAIAGGLVWWVFSGAPGSTDGPIDVAIAPTGALLRGRF